jgi:hypothetical protein
MNSRWQTTIGRCRGQERQKYELTIYIVRSHNLVLILNYSPMNGLLLYIDPGSGSYLLQMIIAGALAAVFYFKRGWLKVKSYFRKNKKEGEMDDD